MIWSANLDGSNPSTSVYDGLGQRVQTTQAGVMKRYFYDINGSVVAEYEATGGTGYGALKRLNVKAGGRLLAVDEVQTDGSKVTSYLMADRRGSTRLLMNAAGAVTSRHDYLPFGEELGPGTGAPGSPTGMRTAAQGYSAGDNVRQRYAGTRLDDATGLDHTLWRKLETRSGRWTTPDPYGKSLRVANPQSFNRYAYVHNDPVNFVDRSGLDELDDWVPGPGDILYTNTLDRVPNGGGWLFGDDPGNPLPIVDPFTKKPTGGGGIDPQNPTPTDQLIDRARQLHNQPNRNDCLALVELIRTSASLFPNVISASAALGDVLTGSSSAYELAIRNATNDMSQPIVAFGNNGFRTSLAGVAGDNQVRHFIGGLLVGMTLGADGLARMNAREVGNGVNEVADRNLNGISVPLGAELQRFNGEYGLTPGLHQSQRLNELADAVRDKVCQP
jgi:RHS repeat-associated protein